MCIGVRAGGDDGGGGRNTPPKSPRGRLSLCHSLLDSRTCACSYRKPKSHGLVLDKCFEQRMSLLALRRNYKYKAIMQAVLIYGSKTCVLLETTLASPEGFHIRAASRMVKMHNQQRGPQHRWKYLKSDDVSEECGMSTLEGGGEYININVCQQTITV